MAAVNVVGFGVLAVVGVSVIAGVVSLSVVNVVDGVGDFDVVFVNAVAGNDVVVDAVVVVIVEAADDVKSGDTVVEYNSVKQKPHKNITWRAAAWNKDKLCNM